MNRQESPCQNPNTEPLARESRDAPSEPAGARSAALASFRWRWAELSRLKQTLLRPALALLLAGLVWAKPAAAPAGGFPPGILEGLELAELAHCREEPADEAETAASGCCMIPDGIYDVLLEQEGARLALNARAAFPLPW